MSQLLVELHRVTPTPILKRMISFGAEGVQIWLCLHRVGAAMHDEPDTVSSPENLDALLSLLVGDDERPNRIVASFDDGYAGSVDYVRSRCAKFPSVDWVVFVCPAKARDRVGFRWDTPSWRDELKLPLSVASENQRESLTGLADDPTRRLATVDELRSLAVLPRVTLGNHTNCHFPMSQLSLEDAAREISESRRDFEALFGPTEHFAFPFGVPGKHFLDEHVALLVNEGYRHLYTTTGRPHVPAEVASQPLRPRFPVVGSWPAKKTALLIGLVCLRERLRRG